MKKAKFIVLSTPRSGSTVFRLWLNSHKNIRCHDEVLLKRLVALDSIHHFVKQNKYDEVNGSTYNRNTPDYPNDKVTTLLLREFFEDLFNNKDHCAPWNTPGNMQDHHSITSFNEEKAIGFKLMYYSLDNYFLNQWLTSGSVRIIHLVRENILKQYISSIVAKKRKIWFSDKKHDPIKVTVDPDTVRIFISRLEKMHSAIKNRFAGNPYMQVSYESFCMNPHTLIPGICDFLDAPGSEMTMPSLKKLNPENLPDVVENYSDIFTALQGSRFEKFLD